MVSKVGDLQVYHKAYHTALDIHKLSLTLPQIEQYALASQIRRASKGICANLAEGFAKSYKSSAEFKRFILMAVGSAEEMQVWLNFCRDLEYITPNHATRLQRDYEEISKMLNGLIKGWKDTP